MRYFLGGDVGGTKTHVLVADETGRALGLGHAGPGNHEVVDYSGLEAALQQAAGQALERAGLTIGDIAAGGFGIGGYDWPSEREATLNSIGTLGIQGPVEAVNDAVIGLIAGAPEGWGVAIIAGTGSNCYGRSRAGRIARMTGMGWWFGEGGGAGDLVQEAVRQIIREWSRRGPATALTPAFMEYAGAKTLDEFVEQVCLERYPADASLARRVFQIAGAGDAVACRVIEWAGLELADLANGVIRQLGLEQEEFPVVFAGSLFDGGRLLVEPLKARVRAFAPRAQFVRLKTLPVVGAVLLAMEQVGLRDPAVRQRLSGEELRSGGAG